MKLGDVLKKERSGSGLASSRRTAEETVAGMNDHLEARLQITEDEYRRVERGESGAERWGPILAQIAVCLEVPISRLLAESGRAADARWGQAGDLVRHHRERRDLTVEEVASHVVEALAEMKTDGPAPGSDFTAHELELVEKGKSDLELWGPRLLAFAEVLDQPVLYLFYPCGLPFQELDDYP